ncbi:Neurochondrin-domain-containing protein [Xylaria nigripes]|nr:Neurochondrin-domain-containing protein [Xylaria nigripes]
MDSSNLDLSERVELACRCFASKKDGTRVLGTVHLRKLLVDEKHLQQNQIVSLLNSISPRFLNRLIRTGCRFSSQQGNPFMKDVGVKIISLFVSRLDNPAAHERLYARIPTLVSAVLNSSEQTTKLIIHLIYRLVHQPDSEVVGGATCLAELDVDSWAPLIEIAPQHCTVFSIFHYAWTTGFATIPANILQEKIDGALQLFVSSFKGHDSVPLLDFIVVILKSLDPSLRPLCPRWLGSVTRLIHDMASSKQTVDSRRAYTHCASILLRTFPELASGFLFSDDPDTTTPVAYFFVKMVQADILSTLHLLMPDSPRTDRVSLSHRIAAALDIMTSFMGFLINAADDVTVQKTLTPDRILNVQKDLVRIIGDIMEYLRDRSDGVLAGARSLEPNQPDGTNMFEDPTVPAAIRLIAIWLREDDGESLRKQGSGLIELFALLYKSNRTITDMSDLRLPIIAALEGILQTSDGREAFNKSDLLSRCLIPDYRGILCRPDIYLTAEDYIRCTSMTHIFRILIENDENLRSHPELKKLLGDIATYHVKQIKAEVDATDRPCLQTEVLELAAVLLDIPPNDVSLALQRTFNFSFRGSP